MTYKEILEKLILHYEDCLNRVKNCDDLSEANIVLEKMDCEDGICSTLVMLFNADKILYYGDSILETSNHEYWKIPPCDCWKFEDVVKSLQFRIDKMIQIILSEV